MSLSLADEIANLPELERVAWVDSLTPSQQQELAVRPWWFVGRPEQFEPSGLWFIWLILTGRGFGKTRSGAECLIRWVLADPLDDEGNPTEWLIIGETYSDTRKFCIEGQAGIINVLKRLDLIEDRDFIYNKSQSEFILKTGQKIHFQGADDVDSGRGFNLSGAWCDEMAKWKYSYSTWTEGIALALRVGKRPRAIITTTPKPIKIIKELIGRKDNSVHLTTGSLYDNAANLPDSFLQEVEARYKGTRIGEQEIYGKVLMDVEGALFNHDLIDENKVVKAPITLVRIIVGVDPAVTNNEKSDHTGIVVVGLSTLGHYYVLADRTIKASVEKWAQEAVKAFKDFKANLIAAEKNNGGDLVANVMRQVDRYVPVKLVTAARGKELRAEPVAALYEQGKVHHVGDFPDLEEQMCEWQPYPKEGEGKRQDSPDRLDALVWAITELSEGGNAIIGLSQISLMCTACNRPNRKTAKNCIHCKAPLGEADNGKIA